MSLNLDNIPAIVNGYMADTVRIWAVSGKSYNEATNSYTDIEEDLYEGPCFISSTATPQRSTKGNEPIATAQYEIGIPLSAAIEILPETFAVCTFSKYDKQLEGRPLRVIGQSYSTFSAHRRLQANLDVGRDGS